MADKKSINRNGIFFEAKVQAVFFVKWAFASGLIYLKKTQSPEKLKIAYL